LQEEFLLLKLKDKREPMAKTEALAEDLGQSLCLEKFYKTMINT